jgi:UDP-N-acetylglucosamine 4,6-dehydratase
MQKKKILITGGNGFLGRNLAIYLTKMNFEVILASRNNGNNLHAEFVTKCKCIPLDITNINSVKDVFIEFKPNIVIHAAATKFVDISENYPMETIDINILGSQNVARIAMEYECELVVGISTDKSCEPGENIYGLSKATMERMFCLLNNKSKTKFVSVRFGNIVWSTGSVFPIWEKMVLSDKKIISTGFNMRRFFFTCQEACELVYTSIKNIELLNGGILSLKMKSSQISEILNIFCEIYKTEWDKAKPRPGDKLDEHLISKTEIPYTKILEINKKQYFLITPNIKQENISINEVSSLNSERLTDEEIYNLINSKNENV